MSGRSAKQLGNAGCFMIDEIKIQGHKLTFFSAKQNEILNIFEEHERF